MLESSHAGERKSRRMRSLLAGSGRMLCPRLGQLRVPCTGLYQPQYLESLSSMKLTALWQSLDVSTS